MDWILVIGRKYPKLLAWVRHTNLRVAGSSLMITTNGRVLDRQTIVQLLDPLPLCEHFPPPPSFGKTHLLPFVTRFLGRFPAYQLAHHQLRNFSSPISTLNCHRESSTNQNRCTDVTMPQCHFSGVTWGSAERERPGAAPSSLKKAGETRSSFSPSCNRVV